MRTCFTAADVIEALGGINAVAALTGRKYNAVNNWRAWNSFPATTFLALKVALAHHGCEAPMSLWAWSPKAPQPVEAAE